jgi:hypothetical protein
VTTMVAVWVRACQGACQSYIQSKYSSLVTEIGGDIQGKGVGEIVEKQCLKTLNRLQKQDGRGPEIYTACEAMSIPVI